LENKAFVDGRNVLLLKVIVDRSEAENYSSVQGDVKITDRLRHKKP
jgi:hypothetical protein